MRLEHNRQLNRGDLIKPRVIDWPLVPAQPGQPPARRRRSIPSEAPPPGFGAVRPPAALARRYRRRGLQRGDPGCALVRDVHRLLREEVLTLSWRHVDRKAGVFRVRHARGVLSSELPVTTQLAAILDRRRAAGRRPPSGARAWAFPSPASACGRLREIEHVYVAVFETGDAKLWFQGLRSRYLAVVERDLLLTSPLTSRLLNRAPAGGIAAGHPDDWTIRQAPQTRSTDRRPNPRVAYRPTLKAHAWQRCGCRPAPRAPDYVPERDATRNSDRQSHVPRGP